MGHNRPGLQDNSRLDAIERLEIYHNDVVIVRKGVAQNMEKPARGNIGEFSENARKRLAFIASNSPVTFVTMITLTYPAVFPTDGKVSKSHLAAMIKRLRRAIPGIEYLWFMEFQQRGAVHYHILTDTPARQIGRKWLSRSWYEIVGSEDKKHLAAGTRLEALRIPGGRYAIKYAQKMRQKTVPLGYRNCGRFFGFSRGVKPQKLAEVTSGNLDDIFAGYKYRERVLSKGCKVAYNAAGHVMSNMVGMGK